MPRDIITADEHAQRKQQLQQQLLEAQAAFDEVGDDEKAAKEAHWNIDHIRMRIDALDRQRIASAAEEERQAQQAEAEERKEAAAEVVKLGAAAYSAAKQAEESLRALIRDLSDLDTRWNEYANAVQRL